MPWSTLESLAGNHASTHLLASHIQEHNMVSAIRTQILHNAMRLIEGKCLVIYYVVFTLLSLGVILQNIFVFWPYQLPHPPNLGRQDSPSTLICVPYFR